LKDHANLRVALGGWKTLPGIKRATEQVTDRQAGTSGKKRSTERESLKHNVEKQEKIDRYGGPTGTAEQKKNSYHREKRRLQWRAGCIESRGAPASHRLGCPRREGGQRGPKPEKNNPHSGSSQTAGGARTDEQWKKTAGPPFR